MPIFVSEQGLARGKEPLTTILNVFAKGVGGYWHDSYAPIPHFITSKLRSLALANTEYSLFDFRDPNRIHVQAYSRHLQTILFFADSPLQLVTAYTEFSGRMRALPKWIGQGAVLGLQGGTAKLESVVSAIQKQGGLLSAVWIQDWQGQRETLLGKRLWWNWELDQEHYPDFDGLRTRLAKDRIKLMAYINPYLVDANEKGVHRRNLLREAKQHDYLLKDLQGRPVSVSQGSFNAYIVDISHEDARAWYKQVIKDEILAQGFSGWMADFGEAMPLHTQLKGGQSADTFHNEYPVVWAQINREAINEYGKETARETVFFMRSAFSKSPGFSTLFWLGDQATSWDEYDGMKTVVTALLSSGLSGFSFNHGDVGGYFSAKLPFVPHRSEELLLRWIELGAFQSVFRTHEGLLPEQNMQVYSNEKLFGHFSRFSRIFAAWGFYREQLIEEGSDLGWPVLRHPFLHYPEEEAFWSLSYEQLMIGSELWYAPVLDEGVSEVNILLPEGEWVHAFTGKRYKSEGTHQAIRVASPTGTPAILFRKGSEVGQEFRKNLLEQGLN